MNELLQDIPFLIAFWAGASLLVLSAALIVYSRRLKKKALEQSCENKCLRDRSKNLQISLKEKCEQSDHHFLSLGEAKRRYESLIRDCSREAQRNILLTHLLARVYPYFNLIRDNPEKLEAHVTTLGKVRKKKRISITTNSKTIQKTA